jgi:hypothetical protein
VFNDYKKRNLIRMNAKPQQPQPGM